MEAVLLTREQKYTAQLQAMGIYHEAFDPEIRALADMERDLQRISKRWKEAGRPVADSDEYSAIVQLRRDILAHRETLGLTPKGLRRLKGNAFDETSRPSDAPATVLGILREKYA